jgi:hypothetical protein
MQSSVPRATLDVEAVRPRSFHAGNVPLTAFKAAALD